MIQCPVCLDMLELETSNSHEVSIDQQQSQELRWELARLMTVLEITRWRQRLLAEQPQLTDLPHQPSPAWWTDQRMIWRGFTVAIVIGLGYLFAPWQLTLTMLVATTYAIIIHPGWNHDERARQAVTLRHQTLPLLRDLSRADFAPGGRFADVPFDATAWLESAWGDRRSSELFQILGWQQELLQETASRIEGQDSESHQLALQAYVRETKPLTE